MSILPLLILLSAGAALSHVPSVGTQDHTITEPERSWAFFETLPPDSAHTWTFQLDEGAPLFLQVAVPRGATWLPDARLEGPEGVIALDRVTGVELEPFTPYASRSVWALDGSAPAQGTYTLLIAGEGGPYVLGYGLTESFTPYEWLTVPVQAAAIHRWEGLPLWLVGAPYLLGLAGAVLLGRGKADRRSGLLSVFAAGLFFGSGSARIATLGAAALAGATAPLGAWLVALALALPSFGLAWAAWRAHHAWALLATGVAGLLLWAGMLVGPALALAAGVVVFWGNVRSRTPGPRARGPPT